MNRYHRTVRICCWDVSGGALKHRAYKGKKWWNSVQHSMAFVVHLIMCDPSCWPSKKLTFMKICWNHHQNYYYYRPELPSYFTDEIGPDLGLILLLNGSTSDYFYPLYNFVGFIVSIEAPPHCSFKMKFPFTIVKFFFCFSNLSENCFVLCARTACTPCELFHNGVLCVPFFYSKRLRCGYLIKFCIFY